MTFFKVSLGEDRRVDAPGGSKIASVDVGIPLNRGVSGHKW